MADTFKSRLVVAAPQGVATKIGEILAAAQIAPEGVCHSGEEAMGFVADGQALLLTTWRLPDMTGAELAQRAGEAADVLMIVPQDYAEEPAPNVMLLRNPISPDVLVAVLRTMAYCGARMHALREKAQKLARTLEERKVVERAKGRLMDTLHLSESEAHYRIQKRSMDTGRRIVEVAQEILDAQEIVAC